MESIKISAESLNQFTHNKDVCGITQKDLFPDDWRNTGAEDYNR